MLHTTDAIVLSLIRHRDNAFLLRLYTRDQGLVQYLVYGNRYRSYLRPLALVEVTSYLRPERDIQTLQSVSLRFIPKQLTEDIQRQCIAMLITETLIRVLRHPMADEAVFLYLESAVHELDTTDLLADFPYRFLCRLSELLGYGGEMMEEFSDLKSFDLLQYFPLSGMSPS